jgi:predicted NBD/HSP70 family sugar kinase
VRAATAHGDAEPVEQTDRRPNGDHGSEHESIQGGVTRVTGLQTEADAGGTLRGYPLPSDGNGHIVRSAFFSGLARHGRPEYLKELNALIVLDLLRGRRAVSRADVARETGISAPTVSKIVERLIEARLVLEEGTGASTGGKRPTLLRFNARFGHVLGVDLGGTHLRVAVARLDGTILDRTLEEIDPAGGQDMILRRIVEVGQRALAAHGAGRPLAVALATPGIVDVDRGVVVGARNLRGWKEVPVRRVLADGFGAPVTVDNDVNLAAVGERWHGAGQGHENIVFVSIGTGIGAGIIIDGQVHRGAHYAAGEVNSLPTGLRNDDGTAIGLEDVASGPAIVRRAQSRGVALPRDRVSADAVFERARSGDEAAAQVIDEAVDALARGIAALIVSVDPCVVVIGGGVSRQGDALLEPLRARLATMVRPRVRLQRSELGVDAQLHGAVFAALRLADESLVAVGRSARG